MCDIIDCMLFLWVDFILFGNVVLVSYLSFWVSLFG